VGDTRGWKGIVWSRLKNGQNHGKKKVLFFGLYTYRFLSLSHQKKIRKSYQAYKARKILHTIE
jgi:hypothetical protein